MKQRLTLRLPREALNQPITYRLAIDYDVASKIIRAQIGPNQEGVMVVELAGDIDDLAAATAWLRQQGLVVTTAVGQLSIDPDRCVDCGICTTVCPTGALHMERPRWRLQFETRRCVVCEQCIPSCPLGAIRLNLPAPSGSKARRPQR